MFKNRRIEVRLAKDAPDVTPEEIAMGIDPEEIAELAKELGKKAFFGVLILMGASFVLGTLNEVIVVSVDNATRKDTDDV